MYTILVVKLLFISIIYFVVGNSLLIHFNINKSLFIYIFIGFFLVIVFVVFFWYGGHILANDNTSCKGIIWKCIRIINILIIILFTLLTIYLIGYTEGKQPAIGYTLVNNERFEVLRVYHDKVLVGNKKENLSYKELVYLQGTEVIVIKK